MCVIDSLLCTDLMLIPELFEYRERMEEQENNVPYELVINWDQTGSKQVRSIMADERE